jgi:nitrate/nitrite transporter NarK
MAGRVGFDLTGSYHLAFWFLIFFYACGSVAFWLLREPRSSGNKRPGTGSS